MSTSSDLGWKVVSETERCPRKIQIKAKPGETYVIAVEGIKETKLTSLNSSAFDASSIHAVEYSSPEMSFIQPSYAESRTAKIQFTKNGKVDRCPLIAR